jgi:hypothetical protein
LAQRSQALAPRRDRLPIRIRRGSDQYVPDDFAADRLDRQPGECGGLADALALSAGRRQHAGRRRRVSTRSEIARAAASSGSMASGPQPGVAQRAA